MKNVKYLFFNLFLTILTLLVVPSLTSLYFFNDAINSSLNIGMNSNIHDLLEKSQSDLKLLKTSFPDREGNLKKRFFEIEGLKHLYKDNGVVKLSLKESFESYFLVFLVGSILTSLLIAFYFGRRIHRAYSHLLEHGLAIEKRKNDLEKINEWQRIAQKMAHELKNPLTPIEMNISDLVQDFEKMPENKFKNHLVEIQELVMSELNSLKKYIYHFSKFAKLPSAQRKEVEFGQFVQNYIDKSKGLWPNINFKIENKLAGLENKVFLDEMLFQNIFINLFNNAVEANESKISAVISMKLDEGNITTDVKCDGREIPEDIINKIFNLHFTTKRNKENMGLGLNIVKKIVLEHDGEIRCLKYSKGTWFQISLPLLV